MKGQIRSMGSINNDEKIKKPFQAADIELPEDESKTAEGSAPARKPGGPRRGRRLIVFIIFIILAAAAALIWHTRFSRPADGNVGYEAFRTFTVSRGSVALTLSESGMLHPAEEYTVKPLISGTVLTVPFEEGNLVNKGDVLYDVDSSEAAGKILQAENWLGDARREYDNALKARDSLIMRAGGGGLVIDISVQAGDSVTPGQPLLAVRNSEVMTFTALFQREFAKNLSAGDSADVSLSETFQTYAGTVTAVSAVDTVLEGGIIARQVTVEVNNPGAFSTSHRPYATIDGISSISSSTFKYKYEGTVTAGQAGIVDSIPVSEGSSVTKGQPVVMLYSETVEQNITRAKAALRDAQLALEAQTARLEDYKLRSPISGTLVKKNYKAGDTLEAGADACTVMDLSYLTLIINVSELDIKSIKAGQPAVIRTDALEGAEYTGAVEKISIGGAAHDGAASFPVTIRLNQSQGLLPGMSAAATVTVGELKDVITVPSDALVRGSFVLLKSDGYDPEKAVPGVPEGFLYTEVTPGASVEDLVVITSGLREGDIIAIPDGAPSEEE